MADLFADDLPPKLFVDAVPDLTRHQLELRRPCRRRRPHRKFAVLETDRFTVVGNVVANDLAPPRGHARDLHLLRPAHSPQQRVDGIGHHQRVATGSERLARLARIRFGLPRPSRRSAARPPLPGRRPGSVHRILRHRGGFLWLPARRFGRRGVRLTLGFTHHGSPPHPRL